MVEETWFTANLDNNLNKALFRFFYNMVGMFMIVQPLTLTFLTHKQIKDDVWSCCLLCVEGRAMQGTSVRFAGGDALT